MSDQEYLQLLAQGRNPVQDCLYEQELLSYGVPQSQAYLVAPLFDKPERTLEENILVARTLRQLWNWLLENQPRFSVYSEAQGEK